MGTISILTIASSRTPGSAILDGIQFNNINIKDGQGLTAKWNRNDGPWKISGSTELTKFAVNAVDIDWNGAQWPLTAASQPTTINTTGDLLKAIKWASQQGGSGGGSSYTLPTASTDTLGGIRAYTSTNTINVLPSSGGTIIPLETDYSGLGYVRVPEHNLSVATDSTLGGIKLGYSTSGQNYKVQVDNNGNAFVNVPWTDTNTTYGVFGNSHGLVPANTGRNSWDVLGPDGWMNVPFANSTYPGGIKIGFTKNGQNYPVELDESTGKAYVNVPWTDNNTTYGNATTTTAGLMTPAMVSKLNDIATGANNYSLPTASPDTLGGIKLGYGENSNKYAVQLDNGKAFVQVPWTDHEYDLATTTTAGLIKVTRPSVSSTYAIESTIDGNHNYGVQINNDGYAFVNVPWTDTTYFNASSSHAGLMPSSMYNVVNSLGTAGHISVPTTTAEAYRTLTVTVGITKIYLDDNGHVVDVA